jgi:hypothetical protein
MAKHGKTLKMGTSSSSWKNFGKPYLDDYKVDFCETKLDVLVIGPTTRPCPVPKVDCLRKWQNMEKQ